MTEKSAAFARGLVNATVRAGVYGGAAYGIGRVAMPKVRSPKRKRMERKRVRDRALAVSAGSFVLPGTVMGLQSAARRVVKIGEDKHAKAPKYLLQLLNKAMKRHQETEAVMQTAKKILAGKKVSVRMPKRAPATLPARFKVASEVIESLMKEGELIKEAPRTSTGEEPDIPSKVRDIADAIRRDDPKASDAKAYRIAWSSYKKSRKKKAG